MIRWVKNFLRSYSDFYQYEWRKVPPPNWRSSRGGREYW